MRKWLILTVAFLVCFSLSARGQQDVIEHEGNKYIIHVALVKKPYFVL